MSAYSLSFWNVDIRTEVSPHTTIKFEKIFCLKWVMCNMNKEGKNYITNDTYIHTPMQPCEAEG